jgi:hypothetical protein
MYNDPSRARRFRTSTVREGIAAELREGRIRGLRKLACAWRMCGLPLAGYKGKHKPNVTCGVMMDGK